MRIKSSLDFKITMIFLAVALLPFLGLAVLGFFNLQQHTRQMAEEDLRYVVEQTAQDIERMMAARLNQLQTLAARPLWSGTPPAAEVRRVLGEFARTHADFMNVAWLDAGGRALAVSQDADETAWPALRTDLSAGPETAWLALTPPDRAGDVGGFVLTVPVPGPAGRRLGYIAGMMPLTELEAYTRRGNFSRAVDIVIVDPAGRLLVGSASARRLSRIEPEALRIRLLAGESALFEFQDGEGLSKICFFKELSGAGLYQGAGWRIGAIQDREAIFAVISRIRDQAIFLALLGIFVILMLATFLSRAIGNPIRRLAQATQRIADGDYHSQVEVRGHDEISDLARSFNEMVRKLRFSRGELLAEKERLTVTLRSISDSVVTVDQAGKIVLMNESAENLSGWTQPEAAGRSFREVFCLLNHADEVLPADHPDADGLLRLDRPRQIRDAQGRIKTVGYRAAAIRDRAGELIGSVIVLSDITAEEKIREELAKVQKLETIGVLAGGIAHDFNNILTSVVGNVSLAKFDLDPESEVFELLTEVEKTTLGAKQLTQQLLAFSKGGAPIKRVTALTPLIREAIEFISRGSNVACTFDLPESLWSAEVDEGQIRQVLNNLAINAIQAMPNSGTLRIQAENVFLAPEDHLPIPEGIYVKIAMTDTGPGIAPEIQGKIFDPFFTTKSTGNGLGLAGSYSIIKKHGGHILVHSVPGEGATFSIYLPAVKAAAAAGLTQLNTLIKGHGRVLVMDDEQAVRKMFGQFLRKLGFESVLTANGTEAVASYQAAAAGGRPFDLVILDLTVRGGMGGQETIARLRQIDPRVRALVSSGYSMDPIMANFQDYGFVDMLAKPFGIQELSEVLKKFFTDDSAGPATA